MITIAMNDEEIFENATRAIIEARSVIENAEAALRYVAQLERAQGITPDIIENYLNRYLTPSQRREIDLMVDKSLREIRETAEQAVRMQHWNGQVMRTRRIRTHI